jgi:hypothetical protein
MNIFPGRPQRANACGFSVEDLSQVSWSREFEDPISLPNGKKLVTLHDAADYITSLPKKKSDLPEWQARDRGSVAGVAQRSDDDGADRPCMAVDIITALLIPWVVPLLLDGISRREYALVYRAGLSN